jgi:hypothetical protein
MRELDSACIKSVAFETYFSAAFWPQLNVYRYQVKNVTVIARDVSKIELYMDDERAPFPRP